MDPAGIATILVAAGTFLGGVKLLVGAFRSVPEEDVKALRGRMERAEAYAKEMETARDVWRAKAGAAEGMTFHLQRVLRHHLPDVDPNEELPE